MRVMLVDDHPMVRQAMVTAIKQIEPGIDIAEHASLADARHALEQDFTVDLALLDLKLPDSQGLASLLSLREIAPHMPVAIISASDDTDTVQAARNCGASGFVSKACGLGELTEALSALLRGESWFVGMSLAERASGPVLTPAQTRVLHCVRRGLMNKQIAHEMGLTVATVKYHMTGIMRKLGVQSKAQLLALTFDTAIS